jgi:hypothetical protein
MIGDRYSWALSRVALRGGEMGEIKFVLEEQMCAIETGIAGPCRGWRWGRIVERNSCYGNCLYAEVWHLIVFDWL